MRVITNDAEIQDLAQVLRQAGTVALDLEFVSESRYIPEAGLVQVAWAGAEGTESAALDPLACDVEPVLRLITEPGVEVVVHGGSSDMSLLADRWELYPDGAVVDTQVAAAFAGYGEQVGYAHLVERALGLTVDKGGQMTDWLRRPLDEEELRYAMGDVVHLLDLWQPLRERLEREGRLAWVQEESMAAARAAAHRRPPEECWRKIKGGGGLAPRAKGALRAVAAWREERALRSNKPPSWILKDRVMLTLAKRPPRSLKALEKVRELSPRTVQRHGEALLRLLEEGQRSPVHEDRGPEVPREAKAWAPLLGAVVNARSQSSGIASRFVATRRDLDELCAWWGAGAAEDTLPAVLSTWRRELVGEELLSLLEGRTLVALDRAAPGGLRLVSGG